MTGGEAPGPKRLSPTTWRAESMGDQSHVTALITGPTLGGLGHHTALALARHGARVILAGRNPSKVAASATEIRIKVADARVDEVVMDLASFESVRVGAGEILQLTPQLDLLVNNAGVMAPPHERTGDGIEVQMATNHFGPFLLTGLLLPALAASPDARVVTVSSQLHRLARSAPLDDPRRPEHGYQAWQSYGQSKLANLLFTYELERRARAADLPVRALAAHPGMAGTHLAVNSQVPASSRRRASILDATIRAVSQSAMKGSWPTLLAATGDLPGGTYVGPRGLGELSGEPKVVTPNRLARDEVSQRRLWEVSEETVGLHWP